MSSSAPAVFNAVERLETRSVELSTEDFEILRATVFKDANDSQLRLYARNCRSRGLDPFAKEIYAWAGKDGAVEIVVGIDGLRNLAENSGEYRGQHGPWFCGADGQWTDVWLQAGAPLAAKVTILREGREPMTSVALLSEFKKSNSPNWNSMPTTMLAKCAEANAIRRQFPRQTTGLYISEEMTQPTDRRPRTPAPRVDVDEDTGEIIDIDPVARITREQATEIVTLKKSMGWSSEYVRTLANQTVGKEDAGQLTEEEANALIEVMRAEQDKELTQGLSA